MPAYTATYIITPDGDTGKHEVVNATEGSEILARNVGLVRAMQTAGWTAFIYGRAEVKRLEDGRTWIVRIDAA